MLYYFIALSLVALTITIAVALYSNNNYYRLSEKCICVAY